jgi:epoxyqueuosine reductase
LLAPSQYSHFIKQTAKELGFASVGISKAEPLYEDAIRLEKWLKNGMHAQMQYMENYFDKRINPSLLVPGAQSVITLLFNYHTNQKQTNTNYKVSKYAFGKDYHFVIKEKLKNFISILETQIGAINGRGFVDSAPVLERAWAIKSGLGWIGKNGNLITKQQGSFFFIATLITDLKLDADTTYQNDYCGTCTKCIDACPTEAILPSKIVDGSKCISYYTIELKEALIDTNQKGKFDNWIFGCDTCQDVCPWNRFAKQNNEPNFKPLQEFLDLNDSDWENLNHIQFKQIFKNTPLERAKHSGLMRNIKFISDSN